MKATPVLLLAILLCASFACQNKTDMAELREFRSKTALERQNSALVVRFFDAVNSGSAEKALAAVDAAFSPDIITHMAAGESRGIDQVRNAFKYDHVTWSDFRYSLADIRADGDGVVVRGGFAGTQAGRIMGLPPTGKRVSYPLIYVFRIADGKIEEWWGDFDAFLSLMTQIGMELRPKSKTGPGR